MPATQSYISFSKNVVKSPDSKVSDTTIGCGYWCGYQYPYLRTGYITYPFGEKGTNPYKCNPSEYINIVDDNRVCATCPMNSIPSVSGFQCVACGPEAIPIPSPDGSLQCQVCSGSSIRVQDTCQPCRTDQIAKNNVKGFSNTSSNFDASFYYF